VFEWDTPRGAYPVLMTTISVERGRLRQRLTELDDERGHIDYALKVLDRIDGTFSSERGSNETAFSTGQPTVQPLSTATSPSSVDKAVAAMDAEPLREWRLDDLVAASQALGWDTSTVKNPREALRAGVLRAVGMGRAKKVGFGRYASALNPLETESDSVDQPSAAVMREDEATAQSAHTEARQGDNEPGQAMVSGVG